MTVGDQYFRLSSSPCYRLSDCNGTNDHLDDYLSHFYYLSSDGGVGEELGGEFGGVWWVEGGGEKCIFGLLDGAMCVCLFVFCDYRDRELDVTEEPEQSLR